MNKTTKTIGLCRTKRKYSLGVTREATRDETALGLALKLHEEVGEVVRDPHNTDEYADVLQALMDYAALHGIEWRKVLNRCEIRGALAGGFLPGLLWKAKDAGPTS